MSREGTQVLVKSISGLLIEATTTSSDGILDQFYRDYDAAFVLPNEKESIAGFAECLALNAHEAYAGLARRFGPFREFVLVARERAAGPRIGGANFIAFPLRQSEGFDATILALHLNYVFVNPPARRRGYFTRLVRDLPDIALRLLAETNAADLPSAWCAPRRDGSSALPQTLVFIEQNDPYRMPRQAYELDTRYTGLDQFARIAIWSNLGARIIDFPYVQPPLSAHQAADDNLVLAVLGAEGGRLDACILQAHLERFFGISVLKGADPLLQPDAARQLRALAQSCAQKESLPLLSAGSLPDIRPGEPHAEASRPLSLPDVLRTLS